MDRTKQLKVIQAQLADVIADKPVSLRVVPMDQVLTLSRVDEHVINEIYDELPDLAPYVNGVELEKNGNGQTYRPTFNSQDAEDEWFRRLNNFMNSKADMCRQF